MLPRSPVNDAPDRVLTHAESSSELRLAMSASRIQRSNGKHGIDGELGVAVSLAFGVAIFCNAVDPIFLMAPGGQVARPHAGRIIAVMQNILTFRDATMRQPVGKSMGDPLASSKSKSSIASKSQTHPEPATGGFFDAGPEEANPLRFSPRMIMRQATKVPDPGSHSAWRQC